MLLSMHHQRLPHYSFTPSLQQSLQQKQGSNYTSYYDMTGLVSNCYYQPQQSSADATPAAISSPSDESSYHHMYSSSKQTLTCHNSSTPSPPDPHATSYSTTSVPSADCCSPPSTAHVNTFNTDQLSTNNYADQDEGTTSPQPLTLADQQPSSPNESILSSPPIIVSGSNPQSPNCHGGQLAADSYTESSSPSSMVTQQYDDGSFVDQYHKQYYPSVGYGSASNTASLLPQYDQYSSSSPYDQSTLYNQSSSTVGYGNYTHGGGSSATGYGFNGSPYAAAYYANYYSSPHQYCAAIGSTTPSNTGSSNSVSLSSGTAGTSGGYSVTDGYITGAGHQAAAYISSSVNSSTAAAGQNTSSLWNYPTPTGLSLSGQQYSKVSYDTPRFKLTPERAIPLVKWFEEHKDHPYPSRHEKMMLCQSTHLTFTQVSTWFANARRRMKKAAHEDDEIDDDGSVSDEEK